MARAIYDRCRACKEDIARPVFDGPPEVRDEALRILRKLGVAVQKAKRSRLIRVPVDQHPRALHALRHLSIDTPGCDPALGYQWIGTGSPAFADAAARRLRDAGVRFERQDEADGRVTVKIPLLESSRRYTGALYPVLASVFDEREATLWSCSACGRGFGSACNRCPGCRRFVGDPHGQ